MVKSNRQLKTRKAQISKWKARRQRSRNRNSSKNRKEGQTQEQGNSGK